MTANKFRAQEAARKDFTALYGGAKQIAYGEHKLKGDRD